MLVDQHAIIAAAHAARVGAGQNVARVSCQSVILACLPGTDVKPSKKLAPELAAVATVDQEGDERTRAIVYNGGAITDPAAHRLAIGAAIGHLLMHAGEAAALRFDVQAYGDKPAQVARAIERQDRLQREATLFAFELLAPLHLLDRFMGDAPLFPREEAAEAEFENRLFAAAGRFALPAWAIRYRCKMLAIHRKTGWAVQPQARPRLKVLGGGKRG